jgi:hypothetical protein
MPERTSTPPPTTRDIVQQGVIAFVLLSLVLLMLNRYLRGFEWGDAAWRALQFAVPFVVLYTALQVFLQRRRADSP